ncbi:sensor histidine kinase [Sphaerisporangium sp. NPDC049003]|uniref:sensor histidine kinase n=1 Tax=Sphaerisporangium sp. NPDC049003 TaxID=3364517 RepID=UPI00371F972F
MLYLDLLATVGSLAAIKAEAWGMPGPVVGVALVGPLGGAVAFGKRLLSNRRSRELRAELSACEAAMAEQHEARALASTAAERIKIARELHDVVAHRVSVMTLGVGAGRMIMEKNPMRARETLHAAEETGRQTLTELQRMLVLLQAATGTVRGTEPQPGLADLPELLARTRESGLGVELVEDGNPISVGEALEISVYRIVQEALSNTQRHASARSAHVALRWGPGLLDVLIRDDGRARGAVVLGPGLIGIRERAALFGGSFSAGALPGGGFEVRARLPAATPARPAAHLRSSTRNSA